MRVEVDEKIHASGRFGDGHGDGIADSTAEIIQTSEAGSGVEESAGVRQRRFARPHEGFVRDDRPTGPIHDWLVGHPQLFDGARETHLEAHEVAQRLVVLAEKLEALALQKREMMEPDGLADRRLQNARVHGFAEVSERAVVNGLHGGLERGPSRHQDDGHVEVHFSGLTKEPKAVHPGHHDVAHDDVEGASFNERDGGASVRGRGDLVAGRRQNSGVRAELLRVIVDDENASDAGRRGRPARFRFLPHPEISIAPQRQVGERWRRGWPEMPGLAPGRKCQLPSPDANGGLARLFSPRMGESGALTTM